MNTRTDFFSQAKARLTSLQSAPHQPDVPGVIWITGYSAAGKTTVGRKVEAKLRHDGLSTIFLDGDDLRSIFGGRWGYSREDRIELARVYFRLCSHLAAQGKTVIIAAVAMYREVNEWFHTHIPNAFEVYLRVPELERRRRDAGTKRLYVEVGNLADLYDEPIDPDLIIDNVSVEPDAVAERIVRLYRSSARRGADKGRSKHWAAFYGRQHAAPLKPSPFAEDVATKLNAPTKLLDLGCGNGRDASYFARKGHQVTGLDVCDEAIALCRRVHARLPVTFLAGALPEAIPRLPGIFDCVYSRFVLHAMTLEEEVASLAAMEQVLREGGRLFIECRSINDPLAREGEVISPTERIHGHYRRFIICDELKERVAEAGFVDIHATEATGLAIQGTEDPVVIRLTATKSGEQSRHDRRPVFSSEF